MRWVGHLDLGRVPRVLGRRGIVHVDRVDRRGYLQRETRESPGGSLHGRLLRVRGEGVFTLQTELERPATTGPTHHLLRSHCTVCPNMARAEA